MATPDQPHEESGSNASAHGNTPAHDVHGSGHTGAEEHGHADAHGAGAGGDDIAESSIQDMCLNFVVVPLALCGILWLLSTWSQLHLPPVTHEGSEQQIEERVPAPPPS